MAAKQRSFLNVIEVLVSLGASVIIFGAWAKITHQPFADIMLKVGMWTEAAIFLTYAVIEWVNPKSHDSHSPAAAAGNPALQSMDQMLQEADITPTNLKKLSDGFSKLGTTVN